MFYQIELTDGTVLPHREHVTATMEAKALNPFYRPLRAEPTSYKVLHLNRWKRVHSTNYGSRAILWIRSGKDKIIVKTH